MNSRIRFGLLAAFLSLGGCGGGGQTPAAPPPLTGWAAIRAAAAPQLALPAEFAAPAPQVLAVDGWEDGIYISRDGLRLYAFYVPADLMSFTLAGGDQNSSAQYLRGPTFGMDMTTLPPGLPIPLPAAWLHGNIVSCSRASTSAPFTGWHIVPMSTAVWSQGAPMGIASGGQWDTFAYTSNALAPDYRTHIYGALGVPYDPAALGALLPGPVTSTTSSEDNPHVERLDATHLLLFFDSPDRAGASGGRDVWYTTSSDNGASWATPVPTATINTAQDEQQPHLYQDGAGHWWIYFAAINPADSKSAIYRAQQVTVGNWDSWGTRQLVIGAGNTAGVGEPSLTSSGDLSFVVITQDNVHGTTTNRYDADPWFAPHAPSASACGPRFVTQAMAMQMAVARP